MPLTNIRNNIGLLTDPWGTTVLTKVLLDRLFLILRVCTKVISAGFILLLRNEATQLKLLNPSPISVSFLNRVL